MLASVATLLVVAAAAQTNNTVVSVATEATASSAPANWRPTIDQVSGLQRRLKEMGFDPGPLDGNIGPRTVNAIRAYQQSIGHAPDGKLTRELYDRALGNGGAPAAATDTSTTSTNTTSTDANSADANSADANSADTTSPNDPATPLDGSTNETPIPFSESDCDQVRLWRFVDSFGSSFDLTLRSDGSVDGPTSPGQWSWRAQDQGVEIVYDNGMGQRVTRIGHLQGDNRMSGEATDSNGRAWNWSAERTNLPEETKFDCQTTSSAP